MANNYYCIEIYTPKKEEKELRKSLVRFLIDYKEHILRKSQGWGFEEEGRKTYFLCINMPRAKTGWFLTRSTTCEDVRRIIQSYGPLEIRSIEYVSSKSDTIAMQSARSQRPIIKRIFD